MLVMLTSHELLTCDGTSGRSVRSIRVFLWNRAVTSGQRGMDLNCAFLYLLIQ